MTVAETRRRAIRWLQGKGVRTGKWRGLGHRTVNFECGCKIIRPGERAWRDARGREWWLLRSWVCQAHQRALGSGREL